MELFINNKSGAPIYDQIYNQIKQQIISGALQPDEAMPSIRGWHGSAHQRHYHKACLR